MIAMAPNRARGATLRYLPKYSPDLNPIEMSRSRPTATSPPAKLPIISGLRAMREIERNPV
jgi:transposase